MLKRKDHFPPSTKPPLGVQSLEQHLDQLLVVMLWLSNSASLSGFTPWQLLELMPHREQSKARPVGLHYWCQTPKQ